MVKGILINPVNCTITEIDVKNKDNILDIIGTNSVDYKKIDDDNHGWFDNEIDLEKNFFKTNFSTNLFHGKLLILGGDGIYDDLDTTLSVDEVKKMVTFYEIKKITL